MRIHSVDELERFAQDFVGDLEPGDSKKATLITLSGDLGAGKTTFVQCAARALGVTEKVQSPTFVIQKTYSLVNQKFQNLIHIDAYRLDDAKDLQKLHFDDILADSGNLILIEWPERVPEILSMTTKKLNFVFINDTEREISYE